MIIGSGVITRISVAVVVLTWVRTSMAVVQLDKGEVTPLQMAIFLEGSQVGKQDGRSCGKYMWGLPGIAATCRIAADMVENMWL